LKRAGVIGVQLVPVCWKKSINSKNESVDKSRSKTRSANPPRAHKRPLSATILTWVVLILTSLGWLRLSAVLQQWSFLESLSPAPPLVYLVISGLVWGVVGAIMVWGLFLGRFWAPRLTQISAPLYAVFYWLDRLFIADPSAFTSRWPFAVGLTTLLLIYTFWVLSRPKVQHFYHKQSS